MSKLSKREQNLILLLMTILVVGVGLVMILMPLKAKVDQLKIDKTILRDQERDMRNKISSLEKVMSNKNTLIADIDELLAALSDPLVEENFDILTQELASNRSMKIVGLSYGAIEPVSPSATGAPARRYEYNLMSMIDVYLNYAPDAPVNLTTDHEILKQSVTLTLEGSYNRLRSYISDINYASQTIFVKEVSYKNSIADHLDDLGMPYEEKVETATLSIDIYFIEKTPNASNSK